MKMPLARDYVNTCNTFFSLDEYYNSLYAIAESYSCVKYIFDYQDKFFDEPHYLRNPDHLNIEGAQLLSTMLIQDLNKQYSKIE